MDCEEYAHGHELAKLLGSPPGYVEHDIEPLLSQKRIDSPHWKTLRKRAGMLGEGMGKLQKLFPAEKEEYLSIVLFDEIEKAHPVLWNATLGILEEGRLTLGNNTTTNFTRSIIMMTSNVGSREMKDWLERRPVGFQFSANESKPRATNLEQAVLSAGPRSISS